MQYKHLLAIYAKVYTYTELEWYRNTVIVTGKLQHISILFLDLHILYIDAIYQRLELSKNEMGIGR